MDAEAIKVFLDEASKSEAMLPDRLVLLKGLARHIYYLQKETRRELAQQYRETGEIPVTRDGVSLVPEFYEDVRFNEVSNND